MNQNVRTTDAVTFATINTGPGVTEVHLMNQNVRTTDDVTFGALTLNSNLNYANPGTTVAIGEEVFFGGGSVTAGLLYYYNGSGTWELADADAVSTASGLLGIATSTGTAATVGMLLRGRARFTSVSSYTATTTIGAPLYISTTAGAFTQTAPSGTGDVARVIGYVQSAANDEIYFCPDTTWVEIT